jgi:hypothetical protein
LWLIGLITLAEGCDLMPIAAGCHAAPTAVVGLGAVIKPENALVAFAATDEMDVAVGQKICRRLGEGREDFASRAQSPFPFKSERSVGMGGKFCVALRVGQEGI